MGFYTCAPKIIFCAFWSWKLWPNETTDNRRQIERLGVKMSVWCENEHFHCENVHFHCGNVHFHCLDTRNHRKKQTLDPQNHLKVIFQGHQKVIGGRLNPFFEIWPNFLTKPPFPLNARTFQFYGGFVSSYRVAPGVAFLPDVLLAMVSFFPFWLASGVAFWRSGFAVVSSYPIPFNKGIEFLFWLN